MRGLFPLRQTQGQNGPKYFYRCLKMGQAVQISRMPGPNFSIFRGEAWMFLVRRGFVAGRGRYCGGWWRRGRRRAGGLISFGLGFAPFAEALVEGLLFGGEGLWVGCGWCGGG